MSMTIYLAEITQAIDYGPDTTVTREAFDSMEKAEAFMLLRGMKTSGFGLWEKPTNLNYEGYITQMEVK